jgi:small-conductance mechanosensitive channel
MGRVALTLGLMFMTGVPALGAPASSAPVPVAAGASTPAPAPTSPAPSPPTPTATPAEKPPAPIPVAEILKRSEEAASFVRTLDTRLAPDAQITRIESQLPPLSDRLAQRFERTRTTVRSSPGLGAIDDIADSWRSAEAGLRAWLDTLTARAVWLEEQRQALVALDRTWTVTRQAPVQRLPAYIIGHVDDVRSSLSAALAKVDAQRAATLRLQDGVVREVKRSDEALLMLDSARRKAETDLFTRESAPIWSAAVRRGAVEEFSALTGAAINAQLSDVRRFLRTQKGQIAWHAAIILGVMACVWLGRRWARGWPLRETLSPTVVETFEQPLALALVLGIVSGLFLYVDPPRLAVVLIAIITLFPGLLVLRRLLPPALHRGLYGLAAFFLVDRFRDLLTLLPVTDRILFLAEMLVASAVIGWALWNGRLREHLAVDSWAIPGRAPVVVVRVALVVVLAAFVIGTVGSMSLAKLLGSGALTSGYLALVLIAMRRLAEGAFAFLLRVRPLNLLRLVEPYRSFLEHRAHVILGFVTLTTWAAGTLSAFGLLTPTVATARRILAAEWVHGALRISFGDVIAFFMTIYVAFLVSSIVRVVLEEEVFPRARLRPGLPYALTSLLRYAIIFVGFILAIAVLGVNVDRLTVLGGAFGIGVGFGLQNVVNNFVSGLIVLFERPVRVGDAVQIGDVQGEVRRIGIRSSTVRTWDGAEVVVPNSMLVSEKVTNWTPIDRRRRITIPINVAYGSAPDEVLKVLAAVAQQTTDLVAVPAPLPVFLGFGDHALKFELRVWTDRLDRVDGLRSELGMAIYAALRDAGIAIPVAREIRIQHEAPPDPVSPGRPAR